MKNVLNFKWFTLPLILIIFTVGSANADVDYLSNSAYVSADSIAITHASAAQNDLSWSEKFEQVVDNHRFLFSILASGIAAIIVLFLFFISLRPKLEIMPIVAYHDDKDKDNLPIQRCQIAIKNNRLFHCNDVRVEISKHLLSKYDVETREQIDEMHFLSIAGCLSGDNLSTINVSFNIEPIKVVDHKTKKVHVFMPRRIIVEVLAQNALSGIVSPTRKIFNTGNFQVGNYVNTTFVEEGKTFKQAIMKPNLERLKNASRTLGILWLLMVIILFCLSLPVKVIVYSSMLLLILFGLCLLLWQMRVYTKAEAYSANSIAHIIKNTIFEFHQHKQEKQPDGHDAIVATEDVDFEEVTGGEDRKD